MPNHVINNIVVEKKYATILEEISKVGLLEYIKPMPKSLDTSDVTEDSLKTLGFDNVAENTPGCAATRFKPKVFKDSRGFFLESFNQKVFELAFKILICVLVHKVLMRISGLGSTPRGTTRRVRRRRKSSNHRRMFIPMPD